MEFLRQLFVGIAQIWQRLSASARVNMVIASLATVAVVAVLVVMGGRPHFVRLYSGLSPDDAAAIQAYLEERDVPYQLTDGGQTVLVPVQDRSRLRVALVEQRLPKTQGWAPGFEIFDRQDFMASRFLQDVNYLRAVQGELQRQLNEFDFVNKSFVFVREGEQELFVEQQQPSEAAVTLDVTRALTPREVKAVLGIVSSFGGANLRPENITLATTDGTLLHAPTDEEFASLAGSRFEVIRELESQREERARRALGDVGVRATVRVSAEVDFRSVKETLSETTKGAVISSAITSSTTSSRESLPEGPPGAMAQLPEGFVLPGGTTTDEETEETIENYEPSRRTTETVTHPGQVTGYRVSAIVDSAYEPALDENGNDTGRKEYVPRTDEEKEMFKSIIAAAVGVDVASDDVTVYDHPFELEQLEVAQVVFEELEAARTREMLVEYGMNVGKILLIVLGFLLVRRLLRRAVVAPLRAEERIEGPPLSPEEMRRRQMTSDIEQTSEREPEAVAALLRGWMTERED